MRQHVRHPTELPVQVTAPVAASAAPGTPQAPQPAVSVAAAAGSASRRACNVSAGGLAFLCERAMAPGSVVRVRIEAVEPVFESDARVAWCRVRGQIFEAGVEFLAGNSAQRARMVEQVCQIELYRRSVFEHEHRELADDEAAWHAVRLFAASFTGNELH